MTEQQQTEDLYAEMEHRLEALERKNPLRFQPFAWVIGAILMGMILMVAPILVFGKTELALWLVYLGAAEVMSSLVILATRMFLHENPYFLDAPKFSAEMDRRFIEEETMLNWLRSYPADARAYRLKSLEKNLEAMGERYKLAFGAMDKLGILPVLAAVLVQAHTVESVSLEIGVLCLGLTVFYCLGLLLMRVRFQLQTYVRLLRLAAG